MTKGQESVEDLNKRLDFIIETFNKKFARQVQSFITLQTKISYLFAFMAVVLAGYLSVTFNYKIDFACSSFFRLGQISGLVGLFISIAFVFVAARSKEFIDPPNVKTLYSKESFKVILTNVKNQVAADMEDAFNKNAKLLQNTGSWIGKAIMCFLLTLIIVIITAIFIPKCARIASAMDNNNNNQTDHPGAIDQSSKPNWPKPVEPSTPSPHGVIIGPVTPSSGASGTALPFGEIFIWPKKGK